MNDTNAKVADINTRLMSVYSVYDQKAKAFERPFVMSNDDMATRAFAHLVNQEGNNLHDHPQDFTLMRTGSFDPDRGLIRGLPKPEFVAFSGDFYAGPSVRRDKLSEEEVHAIAETVAIYLNSKGVTK